MMDDPARYVIHGPTEFIIHDQAENRRREREKASNTYFEKETKWTKRSNVRRTRKWRSSIRVSYFLVDVPGEIHSRIKPSSVDRDKGKDNHVGYNLLLFQRFTVNGSAIN